MGWLHIPLLLMGLLGVGAIYSSIRAVDHAKQEDLSKMVDEYHLLNRLPFPID